MDALEQSGTLLTVAQIAITLIGFTGIVLFLGERTNLRLSNTERMRVFSLVAPSLLSLFACFIPIILFEFLHEANTTWRLSNGILATAHLYPVTTWAITKDVSKTTGNWITAFGGYLTILAHYLAAFGVLTSKEGIYIFGLVWLLFIGVYSFLQLFRLERQSK